MRTPRHTFTHYYIYNTRARLGCEPQAAAGVYHYPY